MQAYQVPDVFNESIYFDYAPVPTYAGHINRYPFRVFITSSNDNLHIIELDSEHSKSYKSQQRKNKWSFLRPEVRFLDLNENEINHIITKDTKIYRGSNGLLNTVSGTFMGVSGYAEFYFVDDLYNYDLAIRNKKYSTIIATLATSGIHFFDYRFSGADRYEYSPHILSSEESNSRATAKQPHIFLYRDPDYIKISENGIRPHINPRWLASNQYTVFSFNWNKDYSEKFYDGNEIKIFNYDKNFNKNLPSNTNRNVISLSAKGDTLRTYFYDDLKFSYKDVNDYYSGGYCKSYFNVATSVNILHLSAVSTFSSPDTKGINYHSKIWLSNPNAGLMSLLEYNAPHYIFEEEFFLPNYGTDSNEYFKKPEIASNFQKANIHSFDIPLFDPDSKTRYRKDFSTYGDVFEPIGYHGINSIAVLPPPSYQAWAIDGEKDMLYKINTNGSILSAFSIESLVQQGSSYLPPPLVNNPPRFSPSSLVLDKDKNLWITLYDNKFVLNVSSEGKLIFVLDLTSHITEYTIPNINSEWYAANQPYPNDDNQAQRFIEPTYVDIDTNNNIWVTYSNYASGFLSKFDKNNNIYANIVYPVCSCPQDLIVDKDNNVWVALSNNIWNSFGSIEKRDTNGNLLSSFGPILGVNNLALDLNQNLWFTYSYSRIGRIDAKNGIVYTFSIFDNTINYFSNGMPTSAIDPDLIQIQGYFDGYNPDIGLITDINQNTDETLFEGIGCDSRGFLYVINSIANELIVYDTKFYPPKLVDKFYVNPQGFNFWTQFDIYSKITVTKVDEDNDPFTATTDIIGIETVFPETKITNHPWGKSLQAFGDWTGFKWTNKFANLSANYVKTVSGISVPLIFVDIPSMQLDERFGFLSTTFYKYIYTNYNEKIKVSPRRETIAKIDNFNLDFYKINEHFDLAQYFKNFALTPTLAESTYLFDEFFPSIFGKFPYFHSDLGVSSYEKIANFVINHSDVDTCNLDNLYSLSDALDDRSDDYMLNYPSEIKRLMDTLSINVARLFGSTNKNQNYFEILNENGESNLGNLLTNTSYVTAGIPVILKTKSLNKYELINVGFLNDQFTYPLSALSEFLQLSDPNSTTAYTLVNSTEFKIVNALSNFANIIYNKNTPQTTPKGFIENASYRIASENILKYKAQLQQQIIDYAEYFYPKALGTTDVLTLLNKCNRDVGLMIDSVIDELTSGVMSRSIQYGLAYWEGSTSRLPENLVKNQKAKTIDTIDKLKQEIISICNSSIAFSSRQQDIISRALENYKTIILTLENTPVTEPSGLILDESYKNASDALLRHKADLQKQVVDYVKVKNPTVLADDTLSAKCFRDVGYIVDALAADLSNNTNHRSIEVGNLYFKGTLMGDADNTGSTVPTLPEDQVAITIEAIGSLIYYINGTNIPLDVPSFTNTGILSSTETGIDRQSDIVERISDITYPLSNNGFLKEYSPKETPTVDDIEIANLISTNKTAIQDMVSDYVKQKKYLETVSDPVLIQKCYRDVGYIVDAIAADIANNTNHRSIDVSDIYFKGPVLLNPPAYNSTVPSLPQDQVEATISAISALNFYINGVNIPTQLPSFTVNGILSSADTGSFRKIDVSARIEDIIHTLRNQGNLRTYRPQGNPSPLDLQMANILTQQKQQIQQHIYDYVESKNYIDITQQTLKEKCKRDVGLMVDAIIHELITGVMSKSIQYAQAYWDGSTTRIPNSTIIDQQAKTIDTVLELKNYILAINENLLRSVKYENSWRDYYEYYEYVPTKSNNYSDNIIDWNNPQTTLINNISSVFDWWGDEKYIDSLFSYNLYKGLGIF